MCSLHLNGHCYGPATAQAECGEASATATAVQFIDEGGQDTGAAGADGVTKRNCSAVDVYARPIPVKLFAVCQGLRGKDLRLRSPELRRQWPRLHRSNQGHCQP